MRVTLPGMSDSILEPTIDALNELKERLVGSNIEVVGIKGATFSSECEIAGPLRFTVEAIVRQKPAATNSTRE